MLWFQIPNPWFSSQADTPLSWRKSSSSLNSFLPRVCILHDRVIKIIQFLHSVWSSLHLSLIKFQQQIHNELFVFCAIFPGKAGLMSSNQWVWWSRGGTRTVLLWFYMCCHLLRTCCKSLLTGTQRKKRQKRTGLDHLVPFLQNKETTWL